MSNNTVMQPKQGNSNAPNSKFKQNGPSQGSDTTAVTFLFWNAGGLSSTKFTEIKLIIDREDADVFAIVEAGASTDFLQYYQLRTHTLYSLPRGRQVASGIILGIRKSFTAKFKILHEMELNKFEAIELNLWNNNRHTKIICAYNPPGNEPMFQLMENTIDKDTLIVGDFNCHSTRWGYKTPNTSGKNMENFIDSTPMEILRSSGHTFLSFKGEKTNPDLALTHINMSHQVSLKLLECCSGYGHRVLLVKRNPASRIYHHNQNRQARWNFGKANWNLYTTLTDKFVTPALIDSNNPYKCYDRVITAIEICALEAIPRGRSKKYRPFWTPELAKLKEARDLARKQAEQVKCDGNNITLRHAQATLKRAILNAKRQCFRDFAANLDFRRDGLRAHSFLSSLKNEAEANKNVPIVKNGREISGNSKKAVALAKYFASVSRIPHAKLPKPTSTPPMGCLNSEDDLIFNNNFSLEELRRAFLETKRGKSAGPDNIPAEIFINMGHKATTVLLDLFNIIWTKGVPSDWKRAVIVPLLKANKPPECLSSYRPVSLTNSCSKIMEKMVNNRLSFYLEKNQIISDRQAGFRNHRSTTEQIAFLTQCIKDGFHNKESTLAVFVDFKSAYDKVWSKRLIAKMIDVGVRGNMLHWFKSFLAQRIAQVKFNDSLSRFVQLRNGLPQGAVTSCTLFNIMINDLVESLQHIPGINCLLFADDIVIYATGSDFTRLHTLLNEALEVLNLWCENNLMEVNTDKTVSQLFTLSTTPHPITLHFNGRLLNCENSVRYLGVYLDNRLSWRKQASETANRAIHRLSLLKRLSGVLWGSGQEALTTIYKSYVRPVLDYGGELLATASTDCSEILDKTQNKALRLITGAAGSTPIPALELQTGLEPLRFRREKQLLKLTEKCKRLSVRHWIDYTPSRPRLKTHRAPLAVAEDLLKKYNLRWSCGPLRIPLSSPPGLKIPSFDLSIGTMEKKYESIPSALRAYSLATISTKYPQNQWLHIYTDGSSMINGATGSGIFSKDLLAKSFAVGLQATNFDAEIEAIKQATTFLMDFNSDLWHAVFFVDSQAAILALCTTGHTDSIRVQQTRLMMNNVILSGWTLAFQWIPSHCGIDGNEKADVLAKRGCELDQANHPMSYHLACKNIIRGVSNLIRQTHTAAAAGKGWSSLLTSPVPAELPRQTYTANFRIITSHDFLRKHLHRIGVSDSPDCPLCPLGVPMDFNHILTCTGLVQHHFNTDNWKNRAKLYWAARRELWSIDFPTT